MGNKKFIKAIWKRSDSKESCFIVLFGKLSPGNILIDLNLNKSPKKKSN